MQNEETINGEPLETLGNVYVQRPGWYPKQSQITPDSNSFTFQADNMKSSESELIERDKYSYGPPEVFKTSINHSSKSRKNRGAADDDENRGCRCNNTVCRRFGIIRNNGRGLWCVSDACGIVCGVFTWLLLSYAEFVVIFVILVPNPSATFRWINGFLYHVVSLLAVTSHLKAMFSEPGIIPLNNASKENVMKMGFKDGQVVYKCPKCASIKPDRTHHCSVCRRCVRKMDHHCPWVNNCVGEFNQKHFVLFTLYTCLMCFYSVYLSIHFFVICLGSEWEECTATGYTFSPALSTIFILGLICEGVLFGLFTCIMCTSQIWGICRDETGIENIKKEQPTWEKRSRWLSFESVFGHPVSYKWLLPITPPEFTLQQSIYNSTSNFYAV